MSTRRRLQQFFHDIKLIAFDLGITIVFLAWVVKEVAHHLGFQ